MKITLTLLNDDIRDRALKRLHSAPAGSRVTFDYGKRTDAQSARFHAMVGRLAEHATHFGQALSVESWKAILVHELAKENGSKVDLIPSLDGSEIIYVGRSTSELSERDFSDLIEIAHREGALHGVDFAEPAPKGGRG